MNVAINALPKSIIHRIAGPLLIAALLALLLPVPAAKAQEPIPAASGEAVRTALFEAQMALPRDGAAAQAALAQARAESRALVAALPTALRASVKEGFAAAEAALAAGDLSAFASARGRIWTDLLRGSALAIEDAIRSGDGTAAAQWLTLREFRLASRFARPGADATLAVAALARGTTDAETALAAARADLWDAYQARLGEALADAESAETAGFAVRRAEAAALAAGYFAILAPAYAEQRGAADAASTAGLLATLRETAAAGQSVASLLPALRSRLEGFRAAPLAPAERDRRAAQLVRFLPLVAVEYERGVGGGRVTRDLEIHEAIGFADGAAAIFADLREPLAAVDPRATAAFGQRLQQLQAELAAAGAGSAVAEPAAIQAHVDILLDSAQALIPSEWLAHAGEADFEIVQVSLDKMEQAVRSGDYVLAESARLDAYAILESGPEARLAAFAPQFVPAIEELFWQGHNAAPGLARLIAQKAGPREVAASRAALDEQLAQAQAAIGGQMAPQAVASNAALIVFREGLEAVLILASLLASLRAGEQRRMRAPLWSGVLLALAATLLTWFVARGTLASLARYGEKLEAAVSLVAVAMLLLILNWFFHDVYWKGWMANFHKRKQRIIRGSAPQWLGLALLGFTSIYREGFESVIFLQALVLEAGTAAVLTGVAIGFGATALLGLAVFGLQARLPHKKMLVVTGVLIGAVLLQMVGNMAHTFQVVGWLPTHPIRWLEFPYWVGLWVGVYPTWEGMGLQVLAAGFTIGSYFAAERMHGHTVRLWGRRKRAGHSPQPSPQPLPLEQAATGEGD